MLMGNRMISKKEYERITRQNETKPKYVQPTIKMTKKTRDNIGQLILGIAMISIGYVFLKYNSTNYMEFFWGGEVIPIVLLFMALIYCADWLNHVEVVPNKIIPKEIETPHGKGKPIAFNYILFKWGRFLFKYKWRK